MLTLSHPQDLTLPGRRVRLRRFAATDLTERYVDWLNDPEVVRFSNQRFRCHTRETCQSYFATFAGTVNLFMVVEESATGSVIGTMTGYLNVHHETADMGILIGDRSVWGRGHGLDAWSTLGRYLVETCGVRKLTGGTLRVNVGMVRIMERSGMALEAVRRDQELVDGVPSDMLYFARFREPTDPREGKI